MAEEQVVSSPASVLQAGRTLLNNFDTPEARVVILDLLALAQKQVEGRLTDPTALMIEGALFAGLRARLAPTAPAPDPGVLAPMQLLAPVAAAPVAGAPMAGISPSEPPRWLVDVMEKVMREKLAGLAPPRPPADPSSR